MIIVPTPGRIVWYTPPASMDPRFDANQPLAAMVVYVWNERLVNLTVSDQHGGVFGRTSVRLLQNNEPRPEGGNFCAWMPYQKEQASKQVVAAGAYSDTPCGQLQASPTQAPNNAGAYGAIANNSSR